MSAIILHPRKWAKGDTIHVGGVCYLVNKRPKRTAEGYWEVVTTTTAGKLFTHYIREEQVEGLKSAS
jgi:hypothetical protein